MKVKGIGKFRRLGGGGGGWGRSTLMKVKGVGKIRILGGGGKV